MPRPRHRSPFQTLASPPGASQAPQGVGQHSRPHPRCGPLRPTEVAVDGSVSQNGGVDCPKHREEKGQLSVSLNSHFCCRQSLCSLQPPPPGEGRGCSLVPCRGQGAVLLCHLGLDWSQCAPLLTPSWADGTLGILHVVGGGRRYCGTILADAHAKCRPVPSSYLKDLVSRRLREGQVCR